MAATPPTPRAPSRSAMSRCNVETDRVALVFDPRVPCNIQSGLHCILGGWCPGLRDGAVHAHYTSTLGSLAIAFTVTSP